MIFRSGGSAGLIRTFRLGAHQRRADFAEGLSWSRWPTYLKTCVLSRGTPRHRNVERYPCFYRVSVSIGLPLRAWHGHGQRDGREPLGSASWPTPRREMAVILGGSTVTRRRHEARASTLPLLEPTGPQEGWYWLYLERADSNTDYSGGHIALGGEPRGADRIAPPHRIRQPSHRSALASSPARPPALLDDARHETRLAVGCLFMRGGPTQCWRPHFTKAHIPPSASSPDRTSRWAPHL